MIGKLATFAAAAAIVMTASADGPVRSFTIEPATFSAKAGTMLTATAAVECEEGYKMRGWALRVIRKQAPAEFFASPGLKIQPHGKASAYDIVEAAPYLQFIKPMTKGTFLVHLNTAGMKVGDYAFGLQGHFVKDGKSFYKGLVLPVTITENDDKTFRATPQVLPTPEHCAAFELTPFYAEAVAGKKVTVNGLVKATPGTKITGWGVTIIRKCAPQEFFDRPGASVVKHPKFKDYDVIYLRKYAPETPTEELKFTFELDTTGFPPGSYKMSFSAHVAEGNRKPTHFPYVHFDLTVR